MDKKLQFVDHQQNFWQLACIQSAAQGVPVILIGGQIAAKYGNGTALLSICLGNLILWMIGLAIISISTEGRKDAIETVKKNLGKTSGILAAIILVVAFLAWYLLQIKGATVALSSLLNSQTISQEDLSIRLGAAFGFFIALLSMGGIRLIKGICTAIFPFLLIFMVYTWISNSPTITFEKSWHFSFPAVISVVAVTLPGYVNLPTFFRHSRSRADSYLGLTLMTIFGIIFQSSTIFTNASHAANFFDFYENTPILLFAVAFVILSLICNNLVNIYFASAGWQIIVRRAWDNKEFAVVGLLGTAAYTFFQVSSPMYFLEDVANYFIANLGIILLMTLLVRNVVKHRVRKIEKLVSVICWSIGCLVSLIVKVTTTQDASYIIIAGVAASLIAFMCIVFVEETIWAMRALSRKNKITSH